MNTIVEMPHQMNLAPATGQISNSYFHGRKEDKEPLIRFMDTETKFAIDRYAMLPLELFAPSRHEDLQKVIANLSELGSEAEAYRQVP